MSRIRGTGLSLAAFVALLLPLALACGGGDDGDSGDVDAAEVLEEAATRFESVRTFHFTLDHENGATEIVFGLGLDTAEGDFVLPDRMSAEARGRFGPTTVNVRLIAIGDDTWVTNPFSREFQRAPASILDIIDPAALVSVVARSMQDPKVEGSENVDGTTTHRISGRVSSDDLSQGLAFGEPGRTLEVTVWVGRDDDLIRRARIRGPMISGEADDIVRELNFSRYDASVTIEPPR
jgi:lipoprotein LprG